MASKQIAQYKFVSVKLARLRISEFQCTDCAKYFCSVEKLAEHANQPDHCQARSAAGPASSRCTGFHCSLCSQSFSGRNDFNRHKKDAHTTCKVCDRRFAYMSALISHVKKVHSGDKFKTHVCPTCQKGFHTQSKLERHVRVHTGEKPFACTLCQATFPQRENLQNHVRRHTGEKPHKCPICGRRFGVRATLTCHSVLHSERKSYSCPVCAAVLSSKPSFQKHFRRHRLEGRKFECTFCKKLFFTSTEMYVHIRSHLGEKPFKCSQCPLEYFKKADLTTHLCRHAGIKPHGCDVCGKHFVDAGVRNKHLKVHSGNTPFKCKECGVGFRNKRALGRHDNFACSWRRRHTKASVSELT